MDCASPSGPALLSHLTRPNTVHHFQAVNCDDGSPATFSILSNAFPPTAHQKPSPMLPHIYEVLKAPLNYYSSCNQQQQTDQLAMSGSNNSLLTPSKTLSSMCFNNQATQYLSSPYFFPGSDQNFFNGDIPFGSDIHFSSYLAFPSSSKTTQVDKKPPLPITESEIALAAICGEYQNEEQLAVEPQPPQPVVRQKRKYLHRCKREASPPPPPLPVLHSDDGDEVYLARFLTTSRDLPLVEVLREYGEHIAVKWRRTLTNGGLCEMIQPVKFACHVAECSFSTTDSNEIVKHMRTSFDCDQCPRRFHRRQQRDNHVDASHRVEQGEGGRLCDDCGLSFRNDLAFTHHKQTVHNACPVCYLKTENGDKLAEHLSSQHDGFGLRVPCDKCDSRFLTVAQLARHRALEHIDHTATTSTASEEVCADVKPNRLVKCEVCGKMLSAVSMSVHLRRKHKQEKHYKCDICGHETFDSSMLKEHLRRHLSEFKYRCEFCDFVAVKKFQLDSHRRRHTGDKPFHCDKCNFAAAWNVQLKIHKEAHASSTPSICERCDIYFRNKRGLDKHIASCHLTASKLVTAVRPGRKSRCMKLKLVKTAAVSKTVDDFVALSRKPTAGKKAAPKVEENESETSSCLMVVNCSRPKWTENNGVICRRNDLMMAVVKERSEVTFPPEML